jgi:hypothetical protein
LSPAVGLCADFSAAIAIPALSIAAIAADPAAIVVIISRRVIIGG